MKPIVEAYRDLGDLFGQTQLLARPGAVVYQAEMPGNRLFIPNNGGIVITGSDGRLQRIKPRRAIGTEVLDEAVYGSTAMATRESTLGSATREQVNALLQASPEIGLALPGFLSGKRVTEERKAAVLIEIPTPTERRYLQLVANGADHEVIGEELHVTTGTIDNYTGSVNIKLGTRTASQAVFKAFELGFIDGREATKGLAFSRLTKLKKKDLELLQFFTDNGGEYATTQDVSEHFDWTQTNTNNKIGEINRILGTKSRVQSGMLYLVARDRGLLEQFGIATD